MKPWSANKIQPVHSRATMMKTLARKVRDWLNGFLEDPSDSVVGPGQESGGPGAASTTLSFQDIEGHNPPLAVPPLEEEEIGAPASSPLNPPGPPEHWLRRVREAAPGLLLSDDEGGNPPFRAPRSVAEELPSEGEMAPPPAAPVRSPQAFPSVPTSPAAPPSKKNTWVQHLKRQALHVLARRVEREGSRPQEHSPFQHEAERPVTLARERPGIAGEVPPPAAPPETATDLRHPSGPQFRRAVTVAPRWAERVKQRIQAALQTSGNRSSAAAPAGARTTQSPNPRTVAIPNKTPAIAGQVGTDMHARPSQPAVMFRPSERPSTAELHDRIPSTQQSFVRNIAASQVNSQTWTRLPGSVQDLASRTRVTAGSGIRGAHDTSGRGDWGEIQAVDQRTLSSEGTPTSEHVDPWPELPEGQAQSTFEWTQFMRSAERVRVLELEQRGGR